MELCNRNYGFFDIASLFVFVNPFSPYDRVRQAFTRPLDEALPALSADERADLLQRFGTLIHERRHFHDVLSTPLGNRFFRAQFSYTLLCASIFTRLRWSGNELSVPLEPPTVSADDLALVETKRQQVGRLLDLGRPAFELSALLAQVQAAWTFLGREGAKFTIEDLLANVHDRDLLHRATVWAKIAGDHAARLRNAVSKTVLALGLGWSDSPADSTRRMLAKVLNQFQEIASPISQSAVSQIEFAAEAAWKQFLINLDRAEEANEHLVAEVGKTLSQWPKEVSETLMAVTQGFVDAARRCHSISRQDPERLLHGAVYARGAIELPQPRLYYFSDDDTLSLLETPLPLDKLSLASQRQYTLPDGTKKYSHRLFPAEPGDATSREIAGPWEEYAKGVAGFASFFEPVNWNHPFQAYCLRAIGQTYDVKVVRRIR